MKNNLMDVMHLLLKAQMLSRGEREIRLSREDVMRAENFDLEMRRSNLHGGDVVLRLVVPPDAQRAESPIILPNGANPLLHVNPKGT